MRNSFLARYYQCCSISFKEWTVPLFLLIISFLTHGLLIPKLGFYWEDWQFLWVYHSLGPSGVREWFSGDREFAGWVYSYMLLLMGKTPFPYLIMSVIFHWISSVLFWWILLGVWPAKRRIALKSSLLIVIYPGVMLSPISIMYTMVFFQYSLFLFSMGAMVWAMRVQRWSLVLITLGVVSSLLSILLNEYYVGLELLRPVLIWTVLSEKTHSLWRRLVGVGENWSPFLIILGLFSYWRIFLYKPWMYDVAEYTVALKNDPYAEIIKRLQYAFSDVIEAALMAWGGILQEDMFAFYYPFIIVWVLIFFGAGLVYIYLSNFKESITQESPLENDSKRVREPIFIALIALFLAGLPIWLADRSLNLWGLSNRLILPFMLGASLFMAGLILILLRTRRQQLIIIGLLVGLSMGFHLQNANRFRHNWVNQKSMFWQLVWRAPDVMPGTAIIFLERPLWLTNDVVMSAQLNFIYGPQQRSKDLDYWAFELTRRGRKGDIEIMQSGMNVLDLGKDEPLHGSFRNLQFNGSTSKAIVIWQSLIGCLRVLDSSRNDIPHLPALGRVAQKISNVEVIKVDYNNQSSPQMNFFQPEIDHGWCYYFQKADLARQIGNWEEVAKLGDEAISRGLSPNDATEWSPFIEGYQKLGRDEQSKKLLGNACKANLPERLALCE